MHDHGHDHNGKNFGWTILINIGITVVEVIGGTFPAVSLCFPTPDTIFLM